VYVAGRDGQAVDFTGSFGHFVRTGLTVGDGPKTMVLWVVSTLQVGADRTIWAGNEAGTGRRFYAGLYVRDNVWCPWLGGGDTNARDLGFHNDPNDGQWHLYVLTDSGNGGALTIYQDGIADPCYSLDYTGSTASLDPYNFIIGAGGGTGEPRYANAVIDDVAVFDRILTTDEMAALFQAGSLWMAVHAVVPAPLFDSDLVEACTTATPGQAVTLGPVMLREPVGTVTHQWYFRDQPLAGAIGASLAIPYFTVANAGVYHVIVDDDSARTPAASQRTWLALAPGSIELPRRGISSHRGANSTHPENTLAAFREAIRLGAQQIELDVVLTNHGDLVIIHDSTVNRTTNGTGSIVGMTLAAIKSLDAGSWKDARFAGERIPTLRESLEIMPCNVWLNVHIKGGFSTGAAVANMVLDLGRSHQAVLGAEHDAALGARQVHPDIMICNMTRRSNLDLYIDETISRGAQFIQFRRDAGMPTPAQTGRLMQAGVWINLYGSNDPDELETLYALGIDFPLVDELGPMMSRSLLAGIMPVHAATASRYLPLAGDAWRYHSIIGSYLPAGEHWAYSPILGFFHAATFPHIYQARHGWMTVMHRIADQEVWLFSANPELQWILVDVHANGVFHASGSAWQPAHFHD
jgi:glycerophosphoryl diester phosphodiesterase